jgi:hypothetical protein
MSKKKAKPKAAARKLPARKAAKRATPKRRVASLTSAAAAPTPRTKTVNIFISKSDGGQTRIRTSPQRLYANPGDRVTFNVVNMIDDSEVPVTIAFSGGGPWGKGFEFKNWERKGLIDAPLGRFKYTVSAMGAEEDPEIELPDGPP